MDFDYPWQFQSRRSAVMADKGMVATSQPLAAQAGLQMLTDGGTAADAAVATAAVLNVVEPMMTGIGGDAFALTCFDGEVSALNGSGGAPEAASVEAYRDRAVSSSSGAPVMPASGGLPVTVPGALDAWQRLLDRYGTKSLATVLEPAITYAEDGFPVTEFIAAQWAGAADRLRDDEESISTWLPNDRAPRPGAQFQNPALARTFARIADEGIEAFYGGAIGEAVVETVQSHGGLLTIEDLETHAGEWTTPISTTYRGLEVLEHPPNGQGIIALEALNILEEFDIAADSTDPDRLHHQIEAIKQAFADGYAYVSDPDRVEIPRDRMLSQEYAEMRAGQIDTTAGEYRAQAGPDSDTIYLTVVDGDGNAVSFINSIYMAFGSGLTSEGFALQNRGHSFSLDPADANVVAPGKRPFHTLIPAMLREDGEFRAAWGVMGGSMQPQGHLQVVCNLVDSNLNPQAAIDAPRFRWLDEKRVALETSRVPDETVSALEQRGHDVLTEDEYFAPASGHWGGGQMIYQTQAGSLIGGSDPRRDGLAIGR